MKINVTTLYSFDYEKRYTLSEQQETNVTGDH